MRKLIALCAIVVAALLVGTPPALAQPRPLKVAIVGDSFSAAVGAGSVHGGYATLLGARGCWDLNVVARSGSGYAASVDPFVSVPRIAAVATSLPDVIIVQGSGNDRGDPRLFAAAAGLYLTYRVVAPQARIVVVGPTGAPSAQHGNVDEIRRYLRDAAGAAGVTFLDPKAERWLNPTTDYAPDGIHPNDRGHARLADRLFSALSGLGVGGSCG